MLLNRNMNRHMLSLSRSMSTQYTTSKMSNNSVTGKQFSMTKMTCTLGPASQDQTTIQSLADAGMSIARLNFSHVKRGIYEYPTEQMERVVNTKGMHRNLLSRDYNMLATLLDTKGPEIRTGTVKKGKTVTLKDNDLCVLTTDPATKNSVDATTIYVDYEEIASTVSPGGEVLLDDGLIGLEVLDANYLVEKQFAEVKCIVKSGGELGSIKGVNLPNVTLQLPSMTEKDKEDMAWAIERDCVDIVAASFVRKASDVRSVKAYLERCIAKVNKKGQIAPIVISKIENKEGVDNFEEILAESDGIMVARGDLGVEINFADLFLLQKHMIRLCNLAGKPVIVATQMLDSMQRNPRPSRAEVTDVGNAVLDGADCVMLSGESANGKYPKVAAETMMEIVGKADIALDQKQGYSNLHARRVEMNEALSRETGTQTLDSIAAAAVTMAVQIEADLIIAISRKGDTAKRLAKFRPHIPIMAFVPSPELGRRLVIHRGLYPVVMENSSSIKNQHDRVVESLRTAVEIGWVTSGHRVIVVDAELWTLGSTQNTTKANCIKVFTV